MDQSGSHVSFPHQELVAQLTPQYEAREFLEPEAPANGSTNTIVLFRDCVARIHDPGQLYRTAAFVEVEVAILDALETADFPSPRVLRTRDGSPLFRWHYGEMTGHGVLLSRCPGGPVPATLPATAVAELLGRLHAALLLRPPRFASVAEARALKAAKEPCEPEDIVRTGAQVAERIRLQDGAAAALLDRLLAVAAVPAAVTVEGVVHLDLVSDAASFFFASVFSLSERAQNRTNLLYEEASGRLSLVDFDFAMPGPLLLDVGFALVEYCCDARGTFDAATAAAFLRAYAAQRPLRQGELAGGLKKYFAVVWIRSLAWLWGSPAHWRRPELLQFGKRVAPVVRSVLDWDADHVFT